MIISVNNLDSAIRDNIQQTLQQVKLSGKANKPLIIQYADNSADGGLGLDILSPEQFAALSDDQWAGLPLQATPVLSVAFYSDSARQNLVFSDDSDTSPDNFGIAGDGRTRYSPPDSKINAAAGISTTLAQPFYWVTATFYDGTVKHLVYRNVDNLLFQSVIIASKPNPKFSTNDNTCVIVPSNQELQDRGNNEDRSYSILTFELYLQLNVFNWENLSEANRLTEKETAANIIRNALYEDRYRGRRCTLMNRNLNGTYVGEAELLPSKGVLKARVKVQTVSNVSSTGF